MASPRLPGEDCPRVPVWGSILSREWMSYLLWKSGDGNYGTASGAIICRMEHIVLSSVASLSMLSASSLTIRPMLTVGRRRRPLGQCRPLPGPAGAEWQHLATDESRQTAPGRRQCPPSQRRWSMTNSDSSRYRASRQREAGSSTIADLHNKNVCWILPHIIFTLHLKYSSIWQLATPTGLLSRLLLLEAEFLFLSDSPRQRMYGIAGSDSESGDRKRTRKLTRFK